MSVPPIYIDDGVNTPVYTKGKVMKKKAKTAATTVATTKKATPRKSRAKKQPAAETETVTLGPLKVAFPPVADLSPKGEPEPMPAADPKPRKMTGLRKPQVKVLAALAKSDKPLSRKEIATTAAVDQSMCTEYLGSSDDAIRAKNDVKVMPSLLTLGHIVVAKSDDGKDSYSITAAGRKALEDVV